MTRLSVKTAQQETTWPNLVDFWTEADRIEQFFACWAFDHFYPLGGNDDGDCFEAWTVLSALAALTSRIRVGLMVASNTYRHPAVHAKIAATLDHVSGGRLEIGLGAGWFEPEHRAYGIELPPLGRRFDMFEEGLEVIHRLLTEESVDFEGRHYRLAGAYCNPKPLQRPRPPIVVGGRGEQRLIPAAARWADHWNYPSHDEHFRRKIAVLHEACRAIGRDPTTVEVSTQVRATDDPNATAARVAAAVADGADHVIVYLPPPHDPTVLGTLARALDRAR